MSSVDKDELGEHIYELLLELDPTLATDLIADLCAMNGWSTEIPLDESSQYGEILATKRLPYPESMKIVVSTTAQLSNEDIDSANGDSDGARLSTIIVRRKPTDEALTLAREQGISIIGFGDVTAEILSQGAVDLIIDYATDIQRLVKQYSDELSKLESWSNSMPAGRPANSIKADSPGESADTDEANSPDESLKLPRTRPEAENTRLRVGLVGYDFYDPSQSKDGLLIAVKLRARKSIELSAKDFSVNFSDGTQRSAVGDADSPSLSTLGDVLKPKWTLGSVSLSAGDSDKYILYVPLRNDRENLDALFVDNLRVALIPPMASQTYRGLPGPMVNLIEELLEDNFKKGHQESYVSYSVEQDLERGEEQNQNNIRETQVPLQEGFPDYHESKTYPTLSGDGPVAVGNYFSLEFLGHIYLTYFGEQGMLLAVTVGAKSFDLDIRPSKFTLHSQDDMAYQASSNVSILNAIDGSLSPLWNTSRRDVSAGGRGTQLLFFPVEKEITPKKLRYKSSYNRLFSMGWDQIEEQAKRDNYDDAALEMELASANPDRNQDVFQGRSIILDSILADQTPSDTGTQDISPNVLSAEKIGVEQLLLAAEVTAWDFYRQQSNNEYNNGLIISMDVTGKQPDQRFRYTNLKLIDDDDYIYGGDRSSSLDHIANEYSLPSPWKLPRYGKIKLSENSTVKTLTHIPCAEPLTPEQIQHSGSNFDVTRDISADEWASLRGLPSSIDEILSSVGYKNRL